MQETEDSALLRQYSESSSEEAFATLVMRHVSLVYSVALRQVGNPHNAEEITQAVFVILAKKAAQLRHARALSSWLFQTTRLTATNFVRSETRRHRRDEEVYMQSMVNESGNEVWPRIAPLLDTAVAGLREKDRQAIVLRFYEGKRMREVGQALGASEDAAEKRVNRALEKLRKFFTKRGVVSTVAIIAGAIAANSVQAAPAGLAISTVSIVKGSTATVSILTLVKGTLKLMTIAKLKTAALIGAAAILATGTTVVVNRVVAQGSSVDESAWARMDTRVLNTLPPAFVLRPTHFTAPGGAFGGGMVRAGNKVVGRAISFDALMSLAYDGDMSRIVSPSDKPSGHYDVLMTDPNASSERLQAEIKRQLGYVAHRDSQSADVLLLVLKQPDAPGLRPSLGRTGGGGGSASSSASGGGGLAIKTRSITSRGQPISILVKNLQGYCDKPILDRTGLTGNYDVMLNVSIGAAESESDAIARALPAQLGLELAPSREPIEMLVVERATK